MNFKRPFLNFFEVWGDFCRKILKGIEKKPCFSLLCDNTHGLLRFAPAILQAFGIRSFASQNRSFLMSGRLVKRRQPSHASMDGCRLFLIWYYHIIPPIPAPAGAAGVSSLIFATTDSVVSKVEATLVAFCRALLVTLAGSRIPASIIST